MSFGFIITHCSSRQNYQNLKNFINHYLFNLAICEQHQPEERLTQSLSCSDREKWAAEYNLWGISGLVLIKLASPQAPGINQQLIRLHLSQHTHRYLCLEPHSVLLPYFQWPQLRARLSVGQVALKTINIEPASVWTSLNKIIAT